MLIKNLIMIYDDDYMYGGTIDYWILSSNINLELPKPECFVSMSVTGTSILFCLFVRFDSLRPFNNLSVKHRRVFLG